MLILGVEGLVCQPIDWLERLVPEITYYASSGALNSILTYSSHHLYVY